MSRAPNHQRRGGGQAPPTNVEPLFDPHKEDKELLDTLADKQAKQLYVNSAQLRRFFGELKDLLRRHDTLLAQSNEPDREKAEEQVYHQTIEPMFKMVRSKVCYAQRPGGQSPLDAGFAQMLDGGIQKVKGPRDFRRFVMHFEAVVGFMYGYDRVKG